MACLKDMNLVHGGSIEAMCVSQDEKKLFSSDHLGFLKQWNIEKAVSGEMI